MLVSSCIFLHAETTEKELKKGGNLVQALFLASINLDAKHEKIVRNKHFFYVQNFQATVNSTMAEISISIEMKYFGDKTT